MQTLQTFLDQAILIWKDSTGAARVGILLLAVMCLGAIVGVGIWSAQPNYVILRDNIPADKINDVVDQLRKANIDFRQIGSAVEVDESQKSAASSAIADLGAVGTAGAAFVPSPADSLIDPTGRRAWQRNNLENQIAHIIRRLGPIEDVNVVLGIPEPEPFVRNRPVPTATVNLTLAPNAKFNQGDAASIASMVANGVPGLKIENVTIVDQTGFRYDVDDSFRNHSMQEKHRLNEEANLSGKAEELLSRTLGFGNALVRVNASFSFPDAFVKQSTFDIDNKVKRVEEITTIESKSGKGVPSGPSGVASNLAEANRRNSQQTIDSTSETLRTEIDVPKMEREEHIRTPELQGLTVSVLINSTNLVDANNEVPAMLKQKYESIVKNAIGFSEARGDSISVEFFPFVERIPTEEIAEPFPWAQVHEILRNISLGLAGLVALLLGWMSFKKLTPVEPVTDRRRTSRETQLNELSQLVKQNPEVFSQIIAAWSTSAESSDQQDQTDNLKTRRAA